MFYILWVLQFFAHLSFLLFGGIYFALGFLNKASPEIFGLGFIFVVLFILQQRSKNNIKELLRDRKDFEREYWGYVDWSINKRYSLRKKREIPEKKVRKHISESYLTRSNF